MFRFCLEIQNATLRHIKSVLIKIRRRKNNMIQNNEQEKLIEMAEQNPILQEASEKITVRNRKGEDVAFNGTKICIAISKANKAVQESARIDDLLILLVTVDVTKAVMEIPHIVSVEEIQDLVVNTLHHYNANIVGTEYTTYRYRHALRRQSNTTDDEILSLIEGKNEEVNGENANKNPMVNSTQRDYMAGEVSKDLVRRHLLPEDIVAAHDAGLIHFHDADYFAQHMSNCCDVNLEDMLQNGTVISNTLIEKPHRFLTACNVATQIIAQIASSQYGGQSITLSHLSPFVDVSRQYYLKEVAEEFESEGIPYDEEKIRRIADRRLRREVKSGVQTIQYQVITLMTTNGQAPFITVGMYLNEVPDGQAKDDLAMVIEEVLLQRMEGVKNEKGVYITPAFPKLIYVLEEDNTKEGDKYWYLTELAAKCTAKRMVPDYLSEKIMKQIKIDKTGHGQCWPPMGCRSFLTPDRIKGNVAKALNYKEGEGKYYGRFNQGVVTINLVDVACSSGKDMDKFWEILDERLELCHKALRCRHERLLGTKSDVAPILWQYGALARLEKGETIDKLLYGGYSTISLGYAGLCEMCRYMTGVSHTDPKGTPFAMAVMQKLNDKCEEWKAAEDINYSVNGTPLESTTYNFAKCLQKRFGLIPGVTDKNYITNSYHVHVTEEIDAFQKLAFEAPFQKLSPGGAISYVEVPNMQQNIPAVLSVIQFIYDNIMYAELNTKSDYCQVCGYSGEIEIVNYKGKLIWECPNCRNRDFTKMNIARRVCGYISTNNMNQGRLSEVSERRLHL